MQEFAGCSKTGMLRIRKERYIINAVIVMCALPVSTHCLDKFQRYLLARHRLDLLRQRTTHDEHFVPNHSMLSSTV